MAAVEAERVMEDDAASVASGETVPTACEVTTPKPQEAKMLVVPVSTETRSGWRLRCELSNEVEAKCEKLRESFERRLYRERKEHEAQWEMKEKAIKKDLEFALFEACQTAKNKFAAFEAKQALKEVTKRSPVVTCGSVSDVDPKIEELREKLAEKEAELELAYATCQPVVEAERLAQARLKKARQAAIEAAKLSDQASYPVKVMGVLDPLKLLGAGMSPIEISALQERIRHPDFHPAKIILSETKEPKQVIDYNHPELVALRFDFGQDVVDEIARCFLELDAWNPSGRYHVPIPWNNETESELEPADIITKLSQHLENSNANSTHQQNTTSSNNETNQPLPPPLNLDHSFRATGATIARRTSRRNRPRVATLNGDTRDHSQQATGTERNSISLATPHSNEPNTDTSSSVSRVIATHSATRPTGNNQAQAPGTPSWVRTPRSIFSFPWNNTNARSSA